MQENDLVNYLSKDLKKADLKMRNRILDKNKNEKWTITRSRNILMDQNYAKQIRQNDATMTSKPVLAWIYIINKTTQLANNDLCAIILDYIKTFDFEICLYPIFENKIGDYNVSEIFIINKKCERLLTSISYVVLDLELYIESSSENLSKFSLWHRSSFGRDRILICDTFKTKKVIKFLFSRYNLKI